LAFNTTAMERDAPGVVTLMKPVSVPEVGAVGPMDTLRDKGVPPPLGLTCNQLLAEKAATVTLTDPGVELMRTVCGVVVTPVWVLKVSCDGLANSVVFCARAGSEQHTRASSTAPKRNKDF
jgi:hypothetical protein